MSAIYKKIMVPLDGSEFSARALPHATELAKRYDAELVLFQTIQVYTRYSAAGDSGTMTAVALEPDGEELAREIDAGTRALEQIATRLRADGVRARVGVEMGNPGEAIIDYAGANKVDLIVMSTHGRTGLARWAFGSVASKVIQAAACPVLTIRPTE